MSLRQLHYTWAEHGLEGRSRLQIVRASEGLADRADPERQWAVQLCTFPGCPSDAVPDEWISVGWLTTRTGRRFVFHRRDAGLDGAGRSGNFAAHVLIGDRAELHASRGPELLGGAFWWDGEDADPGSLPEVSIRDLGQVSHIGNDDGTDLALARILAAEGRIQGFAETPGVAARALILLCRFIPHLLDDRSVSTYENVQDAAPFHLVGVVRGRPPAALPPQDALTVAHYLTGLGDGERSRLADLITRSRATWTSLIRILLPFAIQASDQNLSWDRLRSVAGDPELARELLDYPKGRAALTAGLSARSSEALVLLAELLRSDDADFVRLIARTAVESCTGHQGILDLVGRAGDSALEGAADGLIGRPLDRTASLPLPLLAEILRRQGPGGRTTESDRRWLVDQAAALLKRIQTPSDFGAAWPELVRALRDHGSWAAMAALATGSAEVLSAVTGILDEDGWRRLLRAASEDDGTRLLSHVGGGPSRGRLRSELFWHLVATRGAQFGWEALARSPGRMKVTPPMHESDVALDFVRRRARHEVFTPTAGFLLPLIAPSLVDASDERLRFWGSVGSAAPRTLARELGRGHALWPVGAQDECAWVVARLLAEAPNDAATVPGCIASLVEVGLPAADWSRLLLGAGRRSAGPGGQRSVRATLAVFAHAIETGVVDLGWIKSSRLSDSALQDDWSEVVRRARLGWSDVAWVLDRTESQAVTRWLTALYEDAVLEPRSWRGRRLPTR